MKMRFAVLSGCVLAGLLTVGAVPSQAQKLRDSGQCVLKNTEGRRTLYEGDCRISQQDSGGSVIMHIKLGEAQSLKLACDQRGRNCMSGPSKSNLLIGEMVQPPSVGKTSGST